MHGCFNCLPIFPFSLNEALQQQIMRGGGDDMDIFTLMQELPTLPDGIAVMHAAQTWSYIWTRFSTPIAWWVVTDRSRLLQDSGKTAASPAASRTSHVLYLQTVLRHVLYLLSNWEIILLTVIHIYYLIIPTSWSVRRSRFMTSGIYINDPMLFHSQDKLIRIVLFLCK